VVGEVINELDQYGQKQRGYVFREGEVLAKQEGGQVVWNHDEPAGTSSQWSNSGGATSNRVEMDPLGTQVDENGGFSGGGFSSNPIGFYGDSTNMGMGCAAGSAGVACTTVFNYRTLSWQSLMTFGLEGVTYHSESRQTAQSNSSVRELNEDGTYGDVINTGLGEPDTRTAPINMTLLRITVRFSLTLTLLPQKPADGSFLDCLKKAGLTGTLFNSAAADVIRKITQKEPISPELLAVTWMNEHSDFALRPDPNPNSHPEDYKQWDVGPFGLNVAWTMAQHYAKEVTFKGLVLENVLGYNYYRSDMKTPAPFSGDPVDNGRMAARRLNFWGGSDENKAVKHTKKTSQAQRRKSFRQYAPLFRRFFACYRY